MQIANDALFEEIVRRSNERRTRSTACPVIAEERSSNETQEE